MPDSEEGWRSSRVISWMRWGWVLVGRWAEGVVVVAGAVELG